MNILLTGASGMVGRSIQSHANYREYKWITTDSSSLNLLNFDAVLDYLTATKPDFIIHAAGKVGGIQANIRESSSFLIENMEMGRNLLVAASRIGVPYFLNIGSTCMYPRDLGRPLVEGDILTGTLEPTNEGYALAKIIVMRLAEALSDENSRLNYKTLISSNLYGPYDKFSPEWSHMIPAVIVKLHKAALNKEAKVEIWGTGEARREFLYVGDLANAIYQAIQNFDSLPRRLNIGLGKDYSIAEYYEMVAHIIGFEGLFENNLDMPVGMHQKLADIRLAKQWGWKPRYTLEEGIRLTYSYYKNCVVRKQVL